MSENNQPDTWLGKTLELVPVFAMLVGVFVALGYVLPKLGGSC